MADSATSGSSCEEETLQNICKDEILQHIFSILQNPTVDTRWFHPLDNDNTAILVEGGDIDNENSTIKLVTQTRYRNNLQGAWITNAIVKSPNKLSLLFLKILASFSFYPKQHSAEIISRSVHSKFIHTIHTRNMHKLG